MVKRRSAPRTYPNSGLRVAESWPTSLATIKAVEVGNFCVSLMDALHRDHRMVLRAVAAGRRDMGMSPAFHPTKPPMQDGWASCPANRHCMNAESTIPRTKGRGSAYLDCSGGAVARAHAISAERQGRSEQRATRRRMGWENLRETKQYGFCLEAWRGKRCAEIPVDSSGGMMAIKSCILDRPFRGYVSRKGREGLVPQA